MMRRKVLLILAVPALFMLSILFLMSDINRIPEDPSINTPPIVSNSEQPIIERPVYRRPNRPINRPPDSDGDPGRGGKTLDDELARPFQRPAQTDQDNNNFNFDTENKENTGNGHDETSGNSGNADGKNTGSANQNTNDEESAETRERQAAVRDAYLHAWKNYERYAFGKDELQPPYSSGKDWLAMGLSIVDSIDTMWLMGLDEEYKKARAWIDKNLRFDKNSNEISVFETTIRVVGGLASIYDLTKDEMYIRKAKDLGERLLPAFDTGSGYAKTTINLKTGHASNPAWAHNSAILSECGTLQMEFASLTKHTGESVFQEKALKAYDTLDRITKPNGLYPVYLNSESGGFSNQRVTLGALGDSYYEYLLKYWILTGKQHDKYRRMYEEAMTAVIAQLVKKSTPSGLVYIAEKEGGIVDKMDHLVCFAGAMFALGAHHKAVTNVDEHMKLGEDITNTCHEFYKRTKTGLGPEIAKFRAGSDFYADAGHASTYILRPETVESYFVLYWITGDKKYQEWGWEAFQAIEKHCRTDKGYCGVRDVNRVPVDHDDVQQSFFMAETLKYLYLLFSPRDKLSLDQWVFNTEAHPLKVW
eukprot:Phypoly_transcript_04843.p1 GENE.Phypoly_transcript_04843~~Phypoly_transcript_04843.p1  ORF type:complete len:590 (+),score=96.86 Phypoly_transcript_04843:68-1837(+)